MYRILESRTNESRYLEINLGKKRKVPKDASNFNEINEVEISYSAVTDVSNLKSIKNLEKITFWGCRFSKIPKGLTELTTLRSLVFFNCKNFKETDGIEHLINLEDIAFTGNPKLVTINGLSGLSKLKDLIIYDCYGLKEVHDLDRLTNLKSFTIGLCHHIDLSKMGNLANIEYFNFWGYSHLNLNTLSSLVLHGTHFYAELFDWSHVIPALDLSPALKSDFVDNDKQFMDVINSKKATEIYYNYFTNKKNSSI
ncbi:MAG: leucine-rich repeat protein [Saprospiraceae bacterium]|nr:leucine-rich repeat protein [Saprospiraceae bacterium]